MSKHRQQSHVLNPLYLPISAALPHQRIIKSGKGGISTETGVFVLSLLPSNFLTTDIVSAIIDNAEHTLPDDFNKCFACLLAGELVACL